MLKVLLLQPQIIIRDRQILNLQHLLIQLILPLAILAEHYLMRQSMHRILRVRSRTFMTLNIDRKNVFGKIYFPS